MAIIMMMEKEGRYLPSSNSLKELQARPRRIYQPGPHGKHLQKSMSAEHKDEDSLGQYKIRNVKGAVRAQKEICSGCALFSLLRKKKKKN